MHTYTYICIYIYICVCMYVASHLWQICPPRSIVYKALSYTYLPHVNAHQIRSAWLMMILRLYTGPHTTNIPHRVGGNTVEGNGLGRASLASLAHYPPLVPVMLKTRQILLFVATLSVGLCAPVCVCICVCVANTKRCTHAKRQHTQPIWCGSYSTLNQSQGSRHTQGDRMRMSKIFWLICLVCILKDFHCMICTTVTIAINQGQNHNDTVNTAPNVLQLPFWHPLSSPLTGLRASRKACSNKTSVVSLFQLRGHHNISYSMV